MGKVQAGKEKRMREDEVKTLIAEGWTKNEDGSFTKVINGRPLTAKRDKWDFGWEFSLPDIKVGHASFIFKDMFVREVERMDPDYRRKPIYEHKPEHDDFVGKILREVFVNGELKYSCGFCTSVEEDGIHVVTGVDYILGGIEEEVYHDAVVVDQKQWGNPIWFLDWLGKGYVKLGHTPHYGKVLKCVENPSIVGKIGRLSDQEDYGFWMNFGNNKWDWVSIDDVEPVDEEEA